MHDQSLALAHRAREQEQQAQKKTAHIAKLRGHLRALRTATWVVDHHSHVFKNTLGEDVRKIFRSDTVNLYLAIADLEQTIEDFEQEEQ